MKTIEFIYYYSYEYAPLVTVMGRTHRYDPLRHQGNVKKIIEGAADDEEKIRRFIILCAMKSGLTGGIPRYSTRGGLEKREGCLYAEGELLVGHGEGGRS